MVQNSPSDMQADFLDQWKSFAKNVGPGKGEILQDKKFTQCCRKGKVILPSPHPKEMSCPPAQLMKSNHPKTNGFMRKIRNYINAYAFASMGASNHNTTPMDVNTTNPKHADLYFMDASQALKFRGHSEVNADCSRTKSSLDR